MKDKAIVAVAIVMTFAVAAPLTAVVLVVVDSLLGWTVSFGDALKDVLGCYAALAFGGLLLHLWEARKRTRGERRAP
ncbi:hypothetical protein NCCP1664_24720 [Zafaria cholistanensis]|uniref:Uncharacterized protein n=1 Tax=Zafaria cholistanensis TaxID=1682741 RepID=A0A5A7NV68_9MICC|nr:hypothetical protein [Zafaria cholistanensis]GER23977.1 hypothetical protein NCCP1664_24720 [Zafaria cholistanensis]